MAPPLATPLTSTSPGGRRFAPELRDKVLLPVLADLYGDVLEAGELTLAYADGAFFVHYGDRRFPVAPRSYGRILGPGLEELEQGFGRRRSAVHRVSEHLDGRAQPSRQLGDRARKGRRTPARERSDQAAAGGSCRPRVGPIRDFIDRNVARFAGTPGDPGSFALMDELLENQCYRLSYWRVGSDEINYRRFFDVNDLAALAMEREDVFEAAHALVFRLVAEGKVDGLRIDHPDGLYDPATYFRRLQDHYVLSCARRAFDAAPDFQDVDWNDVEAGLRDRGWPRRNPQSGGPSAGPPLYVVVEKILGSREPLVDTWPVHGTSGYDFLNYVNGLFVDSGSGQAVSRAYQDFVQDNTRFADLVYAKKLLIMQVSLASELHMLTHQLDRLAQKSRRSRDFHLQHAAVRVAGSHRLLPRLSLVHRCQRVPARRIGATSSWPSAARGMRNPLVSHRVFRFIRDMLLGDAPEPQSDDDRAEQQRFAG